MWRIFTIAHPVPHLLPCSSTDRTPVFCIDHHLATGQPAEAVHGRLAGLQVVVEPHQPAGVVQGEQGDVFLDTLQVGGGEGTSEWRNPGNLYFLLGSLMIDRQVKFGRLILVKP